MKKRTAVKIISFSLAAVFVSIGFSFKIYGKVKEYFLEIERGYSYSLDEFTAGINNISLTLKKAQYINTPAALSEMSAKLMSEAEISKNAISRLPSGNKLNVLNKFLSQVGNYALSVSQKLIKDGKTAKEDVENIAKLHSAAEKIAQIVTETQITYNNSDYWAKELNTKIDKETDLENIGSSLGVLEDELNDYPTLVYDGPYSDHILEKEPEMIKNAEVISKKEGLEIAARMARYDENFVKSDGEISGNIPSFRYSGEGFTAAVSIKGGYPVFMRKERVVRESILSYEHALAKAKRYIKSIGLEGFSETYFSINEGVCVFNMAYIDGETVCYTDLIKVGVAMDNGEIMLFEGSGYISNHKNRAFETPIYTVETAEEKLNPELTVTSKALALIPTNSTEEIRCYEFACKASNGEEVLIYINTQTLAEEDVLILLKTDGGILVK